MILTLVLTAFSLLPNQQEGGAEDRELRLHALDGLIRPAKPDAPGDEKVDSVSFSNRNQLVVDDPFMQGVTAWPLAPRSSSSFDSADHFLGMVKSFMLPTYEGSGANITFQEMDGKPFMITDLSQDQDAWLTNFLALQREKGTWRGVIHVTVLRGDLDEIPFLDRSGRIELLESASEVQVQKERLLEHGMKTITEPTMTMLPKQTALLTSVSEVNYIQDWKIVNVDPGNRRIAIPQVKTVDEGLRLNARIFQLDETGYSVSLEMEYTEIQRPIPVVRKDVELEGKTHSLEKALPVLDTTTAEGDLRMVVGSGVQILNPSNNSGEDIIVLVWFETTTFEVIKISDLQEGILRDVK